MSEVLSTPGKVSQHPSPSTSCEAGVAVHDHIAGGADDEISLLDNETAFSRNALVPRQCAGLDLNAVDMSTTVLGHRQEWPIICAPWGFQSLVHRDGEVG